MITIVFSFLCNLFKTKMNIQYWLGYGCRFVDNNKPNKKVVLLKANMLESIVYFVFFVCFYFRLSYFLTWHICFYYVVFFLFLTITKQTMNWICRVIKTINLFFLPNYFLSLVKTCIVGIAPKVSVSFLSFFVLTLLSIATSNISNLLFLHVILDKHIETLLKWIHTAVSLKTRRNLI